MDIQHLKYAVEIERWRSISKAAEKLYVSQPFLSKAIKELEGEIGVDIFNRTSRGVVPTKKGEDFLSRAKEIIAGMEELEQSFREKSAESVRIEISVPIACYISHAFVNFVRDLPDSEDIKVDYHESNTMSTIRHVAERDCNIGIIRYQTNFEDYYLRHLESKDLAVKPIWKFNYHLVMSRENPLAARDSISTEDLRSFIEINHGDPTVPEMSASMLTELRRRVQNRREIVVYERQSQFELLCAMPRTYMWASPTPQAVFDTYPLVQKNCDYPDNEYKDVLIYRKGYRLTKLDRLFISKVQEMVETLKD